MLIFALLIVTPAALSAILYVLADPRGDRLRTVTPEL